MPFLKRGILLAIEGIDGSGKTVLTQNLHTALHTEGFPLLLTKEPGGTELGKHIRTMLQEKKISIEPKAEFLLFAADRAQHIAQIIIPALNKKKLILSDRMADSSVVYQGFGRGLDISLITMINTWAMQKISPDLTFYVRIDAPTAQKRLIERGKLSAFDQEPISFFEKLINGFETIYKDKKNVVILDGIKIPELLAQETKEYILQWINKNNLLV